MLQNIKKYFSSLCFSARSLATCLWRCCPLSIQSESQFSGDFSQISKDIIKFSKKTVCVRVARTIIPAWSSTEPIPKILWDWFSFAVLSFFLCSCFSCNSSACYFLFPFLTGGLSVKMLINVSQSYEFKYTHIQTGNLPSEPTSAWNQSLVLLSDYLGWRSTGNIKIFFSLLWLQMHFGEFCTSFLLHPSLICIAIALFIFHIDVTALILPYGGFNLL